MQLSAMLRCRMAWASRAGQRSEVVVSSRVRLARNLKSFPFTGRAAAKALASILAAAFDAAKGARSLGKPALIRLADVDEVDRAFLIERRLISSLLAREPRSRGVAVGEKELLSAMVNEEDHLRLQGIDSGLCLEALLGRVLALDDELARGLEYAYHPQWGHLTACPTNVGTGMRASSLVHLPGLLLTGQLSRVLEGLSGVGVVARGLYGEGTRVLGDFYQVSNAVSLGPSETEVAASISKIVAGLARRELEARSALASAAHKLRTEDLVWRSIGTLASARSISYAEAMRHLSLARMALTLGWKAPADLAAVDELILLTQPAHVQMLAGKPLEEADRDFLRASLLRRKFKS